MFSGLFAIAEVAYLTAMIFSTFMNLRLGNLKFFSSDSVYGLAGRRMGGGGGEGLPLFQVKVKIIEK